MYAHPVYTYKSIDDNGNVIINGDEILKEIVDDCMSQKYGMV